jgi:hypothetical protein
VAGGSLWSFWDDHCKAGQYLRGLCPV